MIDREPGPFSFSILLLPIAVAVLIMTPPLLACGDCVSPSPTEPVIRGDVAREWRDVYTAVIQYETQDWKYYGEDVDRLARMIRGAAAEGAELVVTPEISLGLAPMVNKTQEFERAYSTYSALADELNICLVVSFWKPEDGHNHVVGYFFGPDGTLYGCHEKARSGDGNRMPFATPLGRVGILICNEISIFSIGELIDQKIDLFIAIYSAGAMFREDGPQTRTYVGDRAGIYKVTSNHWHGNDSAGSGGSGIYDPEGNLLASAPEFEQTIFANIKVPKQKYTLVNTNYGRFCFQLHKDLVPFSDENFTNNVEADFYEGLTFHHVEKGSMLRCGRFDQDMVARPPVGTPTDFEEYIDYWGSGTVQTHGDGAVALYHPDGDTNATTEFFICDRAHPEWDGNYTIIGQVVKGSSTIDRILDLPVGERTGDDQITYHHVPTEPVIIESMSILNEVPNFPPEYKGGMTDTTVKEDTTLEVDLGPMFTDYETPDSMTYSCNRPAVEIDGTLARWSPVHGDTDLLDVVITATDINGSSVATPPFNLLYEEVNDAPAFIGNLTDVSVMEGSTWEVDLHGQFTDEESQDLLVYSCNRDDVNITGTKASWTPTEAETLTGIVITATDPVDPYPTASSPPFDLIYIAVDDPPVLDPIDDITVTEDEPYILDLSEHIADEDTPDPSLVVTTDSEHVEVVGLSLSFLYGEGDVGEDVEITVSDGNSSVSTTVSVMVMAVNDPPCIADLGSITVTEDEPFQMDLEEKITDPDTPMDLLTVTADSQYAEVDGMVLTLLYPDGVENDEVEIIVSDGEHEASTVLSVVVEQVNDPPQSPSIDGVKDGWTYTSEEPIDIVVSAEDVDDEDLVVTIVSDIDGDLGDGSDLDLSPGFHTITITVRDPGGETSIATVSITVVAPETDDEIDDDQNKTNSTAGTNTTSGNDTMPGAGGSDDGSDGGRGMLYIAVVVGVVAVIVAVLAWMFFIRKSPPESVPPVEQP